MRRALGYAAFTLGCMLIFLAVAAPLAVGRYGMTQTGLTYIVLAAGVGFYLPTKFTYKTPR